MRQSLPKLKKYCLKTQKRIKNMKLRRYWTVDMWMVSSDI